MKRVLLVCFLFMSATAAYGQDKLKFTPEKMYHPDSIRKEMKDLMVELSKKHPGFYRYQSRSEVDNYMDSTFQTIRDSLTVLEAYRKLKPIMAKIGCLHTGVTLSDEYSHYLEQHPNLLPLQVNFQDGKAYAVKNYSSNPAIPLGAELRRINGKPLDDIVQRLLATIPSDGYNQTEKFQLLNHRFPFWYRSMEEVTERFSVTFVTSQGEMDYVMDGVKEPVFPKPGFELLSSGLKRLTFERKEEVGILTVRSFARSDIKSGRQNFKRFIGQTFKELKKVQTKNLVLDLRGNTGGTDANAALLCTYLMEKPYRYWDRIEVTEPIAKSIKGKHRLFYRKPIRKDSTYQWQKTWFTREFDFYQPQRPAKKHYEGKLYVLINGLCLSSCSDLTAILSHNRRAVFIGEETGGGYQGNTSGLMPKVKVAQAFIVTVPLLKYVNSVDSSVNVGRGTMPDYFVRPTAPDVINQTDVEMNYTLDLIKLADKE